MLGIRQFFALLCAAAVTVNAVSLPMGQETSEDGSPSATLDSVGAPLSIDSAIDSEYIVASTHHLDEQPRTRKKIVQFTAVSPPHTRKTTKTASMTPEMKAFFATVENGDSASIRRILNENPDIRINARNKERFTALHVAVERGVADVVQLLLELGANADCVRKGRCCEDIPLHMAAENDKAEIAKLLLQHDADIYAVDRFFMTPLHYAAKKSQAVLELLLSAIRQDAIDGDEDATSYINTHSLNQLTPLHYAAFSGKPDSVKALIQAGADVNAVVKVEDPYYEGSTPLHQAAKRGCAECVTLLLYHGADIEAVDANGNSPLHIAAMEGKEKAVVALISGGANRDAVNNEQVSPLFLAAKNGHLECAMPLLSPKSVTSVDPTGQTPLHWAAYRGKVDLIKGLLRYGLNINQGDEDKRTALHKAAANGAVDAINVLLLHGAEVNSQDDDGKTPLHFAGTWYGRSGIMPLLTHGADFNLLDDNGCLPLDNLKPDFREAIMRQYEDEVAPWKE